MRNILKNYYLSTILGMVLMFDSCNKTSESEFIYVKDGQFILNGEPYYFVGTNFPLPKVKGGNRDRLLKELDLMQSFGINNLLLT